MRTINFSDARNNLKAVLDRVIDDADVTIITRRDAQDVVVMSLAEWNSWKETEYLRASPANARRLDEAMAQARTFKSHPRQLTQIDRHVAAVAEEPAKYKIDKPGNRRAAAPAKKRR